MSDPQTNSKPTPAQAVQRETVLGEVTTALLLAMHAHGLGTDRSDAEMRDRATLIISAACETAPSQAVVLIVGSEHDAKRLASAVLIGGDPLAVPDAGDIIEAGAVIRRMVEARHRD